MHNNRVAFILFNKFLSNAEIFKNIIHIFIASA